MPKIPVIIDTDIGSDIDDTWALAMALGCPEIDIKLIVTCAGDTTYRAKIVCKFLEKVGRTDIPVGIGLTFGTENEAQKAYVEDYDISQYPGTVHTDGVAAMTDAILGSEDEVALVCIGPLPNIASMLNQSPEVVEKSRFIGMHGAVYRGYFGTDEIHAEFNVIQHLETAQQVLNSDFDITITPLDTCGVIRLIEDQYQQVFAGAGNAMKEVRENYRVWLPASKRDVTLLDVSSSILFDTVAIYLAFAEDLLEIHELPIAVTDEGKTVVDEKSGKQMRVATAWKDLPAFNELLVERLLAAP